MSNKVLNFIISAKDGASAVFQRVGTGIKGMYSKLTSLPTLIAGSAIAASIGKAVSAFMNAERVSLQLAAALAKAGDASKETRKRMEDFASTMQQVTGADDEAVKSAMALALQFGVQVDEIEEVTKAALGLSAAYNVDINTAMQAFGRTAAGAQARLQMLGIQTDESMSKSEIMALMLKKGAEGFAQYETRMAGVGGAFTRFKNSLGDTIEKIGGAIARGVGLQDVFSKLQARLDAMDFTGLMKKLAVLKDIFADLFSSEKGERDQAWADLGAILKAAWSDAVSAAIGLLAKAMPILGGALGSAAKAAFTGPTERDLRMMAERELVAEGRGGEIGGEQVTRYGNFGLRYDEYKKANPEIVATIEGKMDEIRRRLAEEAGKAYQSPDPGKSNLENVMEQIAGRRKAEPAPAAEDTITPTAGRPGKTLEQIEEERLFEENRAKIEKEAQERDKVDREAREAAAKAEESYRMGQMSPEALAEALGAKIAELEVGGVNDFEAPEYFDLLARRDDVLKDIEQSRAEAAENMKGLVAQREEAFQQRTGFADLSTMYDAARGQDYDAQREIAESTRRTAELCAKIVEEARKGGIL